VRVVFALEFKVLKFVCYECPIVVRVVIIPTIPTVDWTIFILICIYIYINYIYL